MAELLVKAVDHVHPDPEKDRRGAYKKGDIVVVMPDGHPWGRKEGPPKFVRVLCPDLDHQTVRDHAQQWVYGIEFSVVRHQEAQDRYRLSVSSQNVSTSGLAGVTREQVEAFITRWGGSVFSVSSNEVVFDISILAALTSDAFWDADVSGIIFTEESYDRNTGVHRIIADLSGVAAEVEGAVSRIRAKGGTVIQTTADTVTFDMDRADARREFVEDIRLGAGGTYRRRRYAFDPADVDTVLGQGGEITVTATQLQNAVIDRMQE